MDKIPTGLRLLIVVSPLRHEGKRVAAGVPLLLADEPARAALFSEAARPANDDEIAAYEAALPSPIADGAPPSSPPLDPGLSVAVSDGTATGDAATGDASTTAAAPVKPAAKSAAKKR